MGELLQKGKTSRSDYYFQCGVSHYIKGEYDKAVTDFLKAMDMGPQNDAVSSACVYCAISFYRKKEHDKTVKYLYKYLEREPDGEHAIDVRRLILDLKVE